MKLLQWRSVKESLSKIKSSIISLILGFFISSLVLLAMGGNPIETFGKMLQTSLFNNLQKTLLLVSILVVASLAHIVAFKTGLFNIGVAGQMFFSGSVSFIIGMNFFSQTWSIVILFLIAMILGALMASISGILKAFFNVHEVVSTILLNWTFFYIVKNFFKSSNILNPAGSSKTLKFIPNILYSSNAYIFLSIAIIFVILIFVFFWKTTVGFRWKVVGLQKEAALTSGINIKLNIISSMAFSGLIAGFAGAMLFLVLYREIPFNYISGTYLPIEGFNSIAIALLAFSNPFGTIPIALLFGSLQEGAISLGEEQRNISEFIIGIIVYFSAISIIFQRWRILHYLSSYSKYLFSKERKKLIFDRKEQLSKLNKNFHKENLSTNNKVKNYSEKNKLEIKKTFQAKIVKLRKSYLKKENFAKGEKQC